MALKERPYTGLTAMVKINNSVIGYMSGVDLTLEKNVIEVLQFGATYQEKVPAIKNWTGSCDGTAAFTSGGSQHKLYQAFESGELVTLGIFLSDSVYFQGDAYISNLNITGAPDDKMNISCDFEGNGAVTFNLPQEYQVQVRSGVGGTTIPAGTARVTAGTSYAITIAPVTGYTIDKVFDNDVDVTASVVTNVYTIGNIAADHVVSITFKETAGAQHKFTVIAGAGGAATPAGTFYIDAGADVSIAFTPDDGYQLSTLTDNNVSKTAASPYELEDVDADHIIVATFTTTG